METRIPGPIYENKFFQLFLCKIKEIKMSRSLRHFSIHSKISIKLFVQGKMRIEEVNKISYELLKNTNWNYKTNTFKLNSTPTQTFNRKWNSPNFHTINTKIISYPTKMIQKSDYASQASSKQQIMKEIYNP